MGCGKTTALSLWRAAPGVALGGREAQASGEESQGTSEPKGWGRVGMDLCKVKYESGVNYRIY